MSSRANDPIVPEDLSPTSPVAWIALLLSGVGGSVDAIGFLVLSHLFTAHMSGNSAAMGAYFGHMEWQEGLRRGLPIPLFLFGATLGFVFVELAERKRLRHAFSMILGLEVVLLAAFMGIGLAHGSHGLPPGESTFVVSVALSTIAMGLQNTALRRVAHVRVHTTFISGMLNSLGHSVVKIGFRLADAIADPASRGRLGEAFREEHARDAGFLALVWICYATGAVLGSFVELFHGYRALLLPIAGLIVAILTDMRGSVALEYEG